MHIEDIENKIKSIEEGKQGGRSWADLMETPEKTSVEEATEKQPRNRENEGKIDKPRGMTKYYKQRINKLMRKIFSK